jgi:hypothetical protein
MWAKIKAMWDFFNGKKLIIAGYAALVIAAIQLLIMDEFNLNPAWWPHVTSIADKIIVALGGVGLGHKGIKWASNLGADKTPPVVQP